MVNIMAYHKYRSAAQKEGKRLSRPGIPVKLNWFLPEYGKQAGNYRSGSG